MTNITALKLISQQITIYFGLFIIISGVIGGLLNLIIFITLKTFRQTTCAFFLIIISIVNVIQSLTTTLIFTLAEGFDIDPRRVAWFCKVHFFVAQLSIFISLSSISLATIDQYLSMSKYRHLSHPRTARWSIIIACAFAFIHSIFVLIYFDAPNGSCIIINPMFARYVSYFQFPILYGFLPITLMIIFSVLAFFSAQKLAKRQANSIRCRRDQQLTAMLLIHVVFFVLTSLPYNIFYVYSLNHVTTDLNGMMINNLTNTITVLLAFSNFAAPCFIYCGISKRFRKQLVYVLINVWMRRWRQWINKQNNNEITPGLEMTTTKHVADANVFAIEDITLHPAAT